MKSFSLFLLSLIVLLHRAISVTQVGSANEFSTQSGGVIQLNARNFESSVSDGNIWLIEFYTEWCGHCKRFAPTYLSVAQTLHAENNKRKEDERKIMVAKIDGSAERVLSSRFSIRGYPSFFIIDGWDVYEFSGTRSKDTVVYFVKSGYKKQEPVSFLNSPFGPIGQLRAAVMKAGTLVLDIYDDLTKTKNFSPAIAAIAITSVGVLVGTIVIIIFGLLLVAKQKKD
mmetsp:Transcript_5408/g.6918  ORF Transcript_5408/g.6918 Transcript_5408/m.6918 type:complete len:227 (-) Transcript_5408:273-953(-)